MKSVLLAHVGYVLDEKTVTANSGSNWAFLFEPLMNGFYLALILGVLTLSILLIFYIPKIKVLNKRIEQIRKKAASYGDLIPWMIRLSLGIALIGAGVSGVLISEAIPTHLDWILFLEILIGFSIMAGFLIFPSVLAAIIIYFYGLVNHVYLLGSLDFLALGLALLVLANGRPGIDDIFGIKIFSGFKKYSDYVPFILRAGVGLAMIFLAIDEKILNPNSAAMVVEKFGLNSFIPVSLAMWVLGTAMVELAIGVLLLVGFRTRFFAALAFFVLSLSFFYFREAVFSHVTLFGLLSILFVTGSGKLSLDYKFRKRWKLFGFIEI